MKLKNIGLAVAGAVAMIVATAIFADDAPSTTTTTPTATSSASATTTTAPAVSTGTVKCAGTNGTSMVNTEKDCTDAGGTVVKDTSTK